MSEWQPIETAPLDVEVLLWCGQTVFGVVYAYSDGSRGASSSMARGNVTFTHWMPLPEPPK